MTSRKTGLRLLMLGALLGSTTALAQSTSMYEVPKTPNPLGQPMMDANGFIREEKMVPAPPLLAEDRVYGDFKGKHLKELVKEVVAISLKDRDRGTVFWGRNIGTQAHVDAEDWSAAQFKRTGLTDVHKEEIDIAAPQFTPKSYDISFTGEGLPMKLASARPAPSVSTPPGGLDLDLVWVGEGSEADFLGRDVKGKAVLIHEIPEPGDVGNNIQYEGSVKRAFDKGAAAVGLVFGISNNFALWGSVGGKYGFNVGYEDGLKIRNLLGAGKPVKLHYKLDAEMKKGVKSASVWGTLPGKSDEEILIVAHMDGYFQAALDNASGLALMVGLAEHYGKIPQAQRRRTIRFLSSVGHHAGPGTLNVHDKHDMSKVALTINLEHVAGVKGEYWGPNLQMTSALTPLRWYLNASPKVYDIMMDTVHRFNVATSSEIDLGVGPTHGSGVGEISAVYRDAPAFGLLTSPEIKHTEQDTPEWVPEAGMEQVARVYARMIDQVNKLDRKELLPGAWPPTPPARSAQ